MNYKEIQDLIKAINKTDISEFKLKEGDFEITIRTKDYHKGKPLPPTPTQQVISVPATAPIAAMPAYSPPPVLPVEKAVVETTAPATTKAAAKEAQHLEVKSPIVGTFYRSSSPEKPPYLKVGDRVEVGQVVCIVEAMKLFNEIESEVSGTVVKVLIEDASPVEYDQVLFLVDPKG